MGAMMASPAKMTRITADGSPERQSRSLIRKTPVQITAPIPVQCRSRKTSLTCWLWTRNTQRRILSLATPCSRTGWASVPARARIHGGASTQPMMAPDDVTPTGFTSCHRGDPRTAGTLDAAGYLCAVPEPEGAARQLRHPTVRRRTADAGSRPRLDG